MSVWHQGSEDTLSFEWNADPEDPRNLYITQDEQHPEEALRLRIGKTMGAFAADEVLTLLDWLDEREGALFAVTRRQPMVAPDRSEEEHP